MKSFTKPIIPGAGQPVRAAHMENHARAIEELQRLVRGEPLKPKRRLDTKPPLFVYNWKNSNGDFKYGVVPGYCTWQNINGIVGYEIPTLGGTSLEADPAPEGTLPAAACYVYLRVQTTNKGVVTGTVTITASSSTESSTHHVPPDVGDPSGTAGDYYFLIAQFEDDGNGDPQIVRRITGNRNIPNQLVQVDNLGSGKKIHQGYAAGTDKHQVRSIRQRASSEQIHVKYDNEDAGGDEDDAVEIIVEGNEKDGTLRFEDCNGTEIFSLTWVDGLITNAAGETIVVPDCPGTTI